MRIRKRPKLRMSEERGYEINKHKYTFDSFIIHSIKKRCLIAELMQIARHVCKRINKCKSFV